MTTSQRLSTSVTTTDGMYGAARKLAPASSTGPSSVDITAAPRAVLRESVRLLYRVLGEERLGTARGNAWDAVCADRERALERAEIERALKSARRR